MSNSDRRSFLRGGLRAALGAGGLLLPWQGGAALVLPDTDATARLPITIGALPVSAECLELRHINDLLRDHRTRGPQERLGIDASQKRWASLLHRYEAVSQTIYGRPATWSKAAEIAEIAWFWALKEEAGATDEGGSYTYYTGRLQRTDRDPFGNGRYHNRYELAANAALIETVLTLSGGERYDSRIEHALGVDYIHGGSKESLAAVLARSTGGAHG